MEKETEYIYRIPKFADKSSQDNVKEFIRRLGAHTDAGIIHVAGTNGKGSVCAYLDSILRHAGYRVGLFTSPHLVVLNERIVIDGRMVSDEEFSEAFETARKVALEMVSDGFAHPAFFEFLFGMGMYIFAKKSLDYIILETGLGGRLDATNIFDSPRATVITSISLDHTDILGDTYEQIAAEKAGIIKHKVPVIFADRMETVTGVITDRAAALEAPAYPVSASDASDIEVSDKKIDFLLHNRYYDNKRISVNSPGMYQIENASLAAVCAHILGISDEYIRTGIADTGWLGRMDTLKTGVVVDGAHNEDGIKLFLQSVAANSSDTGRNALMFSAVKDKHYRGMIGQICESGLFDRIIITRIDDSRGLDCSVMQECFADAGSQDCRIISDTKQAYAECVRMVQSGYNVYVCGSLYLAGQVISADKELV